KSKGKIELSQNGQIMLFESVLMTLDETEIPYFSSFKKSPDFLKKLVDLRTELQEAQLELSALTENPKNRELELILEKFEQAYAKINPTSSVSQDFLQALYDKKFTTTLQQSIFIIAGFTRFTAEEKMMIETLDQFSDAVIIGTYLDKNAIFTESVYQLSEKMIADFGVQSEFIAPQAVNQVYSKLTRLIENDATFTLSALTNLEKKEAAYFQIWEADNQTAEIEMVAKEIKQKLAMDSTLRYKNFTVVVGDSTAYFLPLQEIFTRFEIPYFYAKQEAMADHPLVLLLEHLLSIHKKNYRLNDVLGLLKTHLYQPIEFSQETLDSFEYRVTKAQFSGKLKFSAPLENKKLDRFREKMLGKNSPIQLFLSQKKKKSGETWIKEFQNFLSQAKVSETMSLFLNQSERANDHVSAAKHEQIWKLLELNLREFLLIFSEIELSLTDFLELILSGLKTATYRQIPSNADSVTVKDYELIEPRTNHFVYAIGLSQSNFPRIKENHTLISDEDREKFDALEDFGHSNYPKQLLTTLSLLNSATKKLTLSAPQIIENEAVESSPIFKILLAHAAPEIKRFIHATNSSETLEHMANSRAMIAEIGGIERELAMHAASEKKHPFWGSIFRLLTQQDEKFAALSGKIARDIQTVKLSTQTLQQVYSQGLTGSVSAFEDFYKCQYRYFLSKTLGIEDFEPETINASKIGSYSHKIFEKLMSDEALSVANFDDKLSQVFVSADKEAQLTDIFKKDNVSAFIYENVKASIWQTAAVLKQALTEGIVPVSGGQEKKIRGLEIYQGLKLNGSIDQIEKFPNQKIMIVDYKSGNTAFNVRDVVDSTHLQLLTYLDVLRHETPNDIFLGAFYLHIQNQVFPFSKVDTLDELSKKMMTDGIYHGLRISTKNETGKYMAAESSLIKDSSQTNVFTPSEVTELLKMNQSSFESAAGVIHSGTVKINPSYKNDTVLGCAYCPFKSICRFEADRHMLEIGRPLSVASISEIKKNLMKKEV
ncbi:MAG: PD-(D/E)XK nuclease family protein, partial [Streptococcaceae bacterium]|nr:PD-(D/E)XK nuclease family protein [Streptococcaceae bacterium]